MYQGTPFPLPSGPKPALWMRSGSLVSGAVTCPILDPFCRRSWPISISCSLWPMSGRGVPKVHTSPMGIVLWHPSCILLSPNWSLQKSLRVKAGDPCCRGHWRSILVVVSPPYPPSLFLFILPSMATDSKT